MEKTLAAFLPQESILQDWAEDESEDFAALFDRYYKRIYNYMYYRLGNPHEAEELTSQVFERVLEKRNTYCREKAPFEVWLFTIARNIINDYYRRKKRWQWLPLENMRNLVSKQPDPEEAALHREEKNTILKALDALGERERNIIAMKFAGELKNREIAELIGITESHVGVLIYRSLHRLREQLENRE